MGAPNHYSRDVAIRCQSLLTHLGPFVERGLPDDHRFGGPLTTTFLLAMATPMVVLPVERVFKSRNGKPGAADDRSLDENLARSVDGVFGEGKTFSEAPFGKSAVWTRATSGPFNIAHPWDQTLLNRLGRPEAEHAAQQASAKSMMLDLRNALAHGGVTYLDKHGRQSFDRAAMLAFVGTQWKDRKVVGFNIIRVSEEGFRRFLCAWSEWLRTTGVDLALAEEPGIAA